MVSKGNHPKMALVQVSEILNFPQIYATVYGKARNIGVTNLYPWDGLKWLKSPETRETMGFGEDWTQPS